ncbi:MAG: hypothetical protein IPH52_11855 [Leptospiraceae bacterium]|nr:hypothetical protein [Leptospiraceae bacterium]
MNACLFCQVKKTFLTEHAEFTERIDSILYLLRVLCEKNLLLHNSMEI